jgi:hypothetical protein
VRAGGRAFMGGGEKERDGQRARRVRVEETMDV